MILEMAGVCGCDPGPLTYRKLEIMWLAKARMIWDQSAHIRATVINMFKDKKKSEVKPDILNPYSEKNLKNGGTSK